ncbi:MAG: alanine racemase, partial [Specibacter sp.]
MNEKMYGTAPLTARLEPWMEELLNNPSLCRELIDAHGSPVNLHHFTALGRNAEELRMAAAAHGIDFDIYFARKANKTMGAIDQAIREECGVDVASLHELRQCLGRGVPAERIILTAAVKSKALLQLAIASRVTISVDNHDELLDVIDLADGRGGAPSVALRLAVDHPAVPPTRFGLRASHWLEALRDPELAARVTVAGIHFHLNGYDPSARALGISEALSLIHRLRDMGHEPTFVDMGGGIPMSYLDCSAQWDDFW